MYDAIVVGARCGGSPTAMLLARRGFKVLLVDKATFPSDTISSCQPTTASLFMIAASSSPVRVSTSLGSSSSTR